MAMSRKTDHSSPRGSQILLQLPGRVDDFANPDIDTLWVRDAA